MVENCFPPEKSGSCRSAFFNGTKQWFLCEIKTYCSNPCSFEFWCKVMNTFRYVRESTASTLFNLLKKVKQFWVKKGFRRSTWRRQKSRSLAFFDQSFVHDFQCTGNLPSCSFLTSLLPKMRNCQTKKCFGWRWFSAGKRLKKVVQFSWNGCFGFHIFHFRHSRRFSAFWSLMRAIVPVYCMKNYGFKPISNLFMKQLPPHQRTLLTKFIQSVYGRLAICGSWPGLVPEPALQLQFGYGIQGNSRKNDPC